MKTRLAIIVAAIGLASSAGAARAQGNDKGSLGAGLIIGEPFGVSVRLYLKDDQAIQAAVGSAFIGVGLQAHADYCFHPWILEERDTFVLPVYVGPGVRAIKYDGGSNTEDYYAIGLRAVVGIVFDFKNVPLDAFLEIAGVGEYAFEDGKKWGVALNGGAGVRYFF